MCCGKEDGGVCCGKEDGGVWIWCVCGIVEVRGWRVRNEVSDRAINAVEKSERGVACCKGGWKRAGGCVWEKIKKRES